MAATLRATNSGEGTNDVVAPTGTTTGDVLLVACYAINGTVTGHADFDLLDTLTIPSVEVTIWQRVIEAGDPDFWLFDVTGTFGWINASVVGARVTSPVTPSDGNTGLAAASHPLATIVSAANNGLILAFDISSGTITDAPDGYSLDRNVANRAVATVAANVDTSTAGKAFTDNANVNFATFAAVVNGEDDPPPASLPPDQLMADLSYSNAVAITKSDTVNFDLVNNSPVCDAIYVGGAGIVVAVLQNDATVNYTCVAGQLLAVRAKRVNSTTTTATLMVAQYSV